MNKLKNTRQQNTSRHDVRFPGGRDRALSAVSKPSTTDQSCSNQKQLPQSSLGPRAERKIKDQCKGYRRGIVCRRGEGTTWLPRSLASLGILSYPRLWVSSSRVEFHLWSSDGRAELGISFIPFHARTCLHLGASTIYNQQMNRNTNKRPCWVVFQGTSIEGMVRKYFLREQVLIYRPEGGRSECEHSDKWISPRRRRIFGEFTLFAPCCLLF